MFLDECHFYQRGTRIRTWYPPEDRDPFVFQEPGRKGISVFGAISISDGKLFTKIAEKYNSMTFLEFLCIVHSKFPNSTVVLDNALYHHASVVMEFAFLTGMDLLLLPPYLPEPVGASRKTILLVVKALTIYSMAPACPFLYTTFPVPLL